LDQKTASPQRFLELLEARAPARRRPRDDAESRRQINASILSAPVASATRDSLVAVGTSTQPLSARQRQLGLDVLPVSNGGRVVHVFKTGAL